MGGCVSSKQFHAANRHGPSTNSLSRLLSHNSSKRPQPQEEEASHAAPRTRPPLPDANAIAAPIALGVVLDKDTGTPGHAPLDATGANGELMEEHGLRTDPESKLRVVDVPNVENSQHVAAGWPRWLTEVAPEAVRGWLPRKAESFHKLDKIGQGTYSSVYKARDLENGKLVALKKVRFANMDPESVRFMAREIQILRRLNHPNVVKLEGLVTSCMSSSLYLVFEYMEHDLAGLASTPAIKFTEPQVKCYMQQLLSGLDHCHSHGVLHRDIKGANLLLDNNGILKIADFGLATFFNPNQKQHLTSRVVTLWYRPPELLLGATNYGAAVDLWSAGCILAELLSGRPIMPGRTEVEQLHKIFKLCGSPSEEFWANLKLSRATIFKPQHPYRRCVNDVYKDFSSSALALLGCLLAVEPDSRGTTASALESDFFAKKPYACDPSSLPKYPPSKEYDAKLRHEEARRQRASGLKGQDNETGRRKQSEAPNGNGDLQQRRVQGGNPKGNGYKFTPEEDGVPGFPIDPPARVGENVFSQQRVPMMHGGRSSSTLGRSNGSGQKTQRFYTSEMSSAAGQRGSVTQSSNLGDGAKRPHLREQRSSSRYPSRRSEWTQRIQERPLFSNRKDGGGVATKEPMVVNGCRKKSRVLYSGPLMPHGDGGNMEEVLKEHERQIQQAVRRARTESKGGRRYGVGVGGR